MKVYHGSLDIVRRPQIRVPNRTLDYGCGFYATTSERQAADWALRRMAENNADCCYVNVYEYDEFGAQQLQRLIFAEPDKEWVEFVMKNRTCAGFSHGYDIVYGPVANDRVYFQFVLYEAGAISVDTLISELKTYKLVDQYLFHTQRALELLQFVESIKISK